MLMEYRFRGVNPQGRAIQGTVNVHSFKEAKDYIARLVQRYNLNIQAMERKRYFAYTVFLPGHKPIRKYQSAYTKEEVAAVLTKLGYNDFKIRPVLLDLRFRPGLQDVLMFVQLSTNMLKDKMSFGKVLEMLAEEQSNRMLRETLIQIESQLRSGGEGCAVFNHHAEVFGKFPAYMLGLATRSGNMAEVFEATGKFMQRSADIRKNIRKALISPMMAVLATIFALGYYVKEIFPATAELFLSYNMPLPSMTKSTLELSHWLDRFGLVLVGGLLLMIFIFWRWISTPMGREWFDRAITRLPVVGNLIHKSAIEMYFCVFATIYSGAGDNIEIIRISSEACRNTWIEKQIKTVTIPKMLKEGEAFVPAMEASGVFTRMAITRLRTGHESGNVLQAAQQIAKFYEAETTYKLNNLIEYMQTVVALFISIAITLLTVISAEISTISPPTGF